jgi:acetoin utilization deacetylase AcuC-like enzyme
VGNVTCISLVRKSSNESRNTNTAHAVFVFFWCNMMQTIYTERHADHHPQLEFFEGELKPYHDSPKRAHIILQAIRQSALGPVSEPEDHGLEPILAVHDAEYVAYLQRAYATWIAEGGIPAGVYPDTFSTRRVGHRPTQIAALAGYYSSDLTAIITAGTWQAAYWSAQCALTAAHQVLNGARACFALCRPPGHHAAADMCGGYCFLNNAAIAAQALIAQTPGPSRVALLDVDFHHGNGTQSVFYARADVLYVSLHADPDRQYPYFWGAADECGEGAGVGATVNFPLPAGVTDAQYLAVLHEALLRIRDYAPQYLVVSLGVDTYAGDPLGDFLLTDDAFPLIGKQVAQLNLPTVFIMEGGYAIQQLGRNVASVLGGYQSVYN